MSDKNDVQVNKNPNDWIIWIEKAISENDIKYYEYEHFHNIKKIGKNVYRANWKNSEKCFVLKSFNVNSTNVKEIIHELELRREGDLNKKIVKFFGITDKENLIDQTKKCLLVMEYADGNSLRNYLKENFNNLTWKDKHEMAYQLACAVLFLHDRWIVHCNLHPGSILVHQNTIKLADFGFLSKRIKESNNQRSNSFDKIPYIDPKWFNNFNVIKQSPLNEKSDVYSIGVLLWEISSGRLPFKDEPFDTGLAMRILQGYRETIVPNTPLDYSILYTECWDNEPDNRPTMDQVVAKLKAIITKNKTITQKPKLNFDYGNTSNTNDSSNEELFQIIPNFNKIKIKEIEPTTQNIHGNIYEEDLSIIIDELVKLYFKEVNEGKEEKIRRKDVFKIINTFNISIKEIYNWLLNNQNNSNSFYLLGYFNYYGIGTIINKQKAFELYKKSAELGNNIAKFSLALMYIDGDGTIINHIKAFELSNKLVEKKYLSGINLLGYCYYNGIGTDVNRLKAFELYQKAADLGNNLAQYNLALLHIHGSEFGLDDDDKAFELSKKSADGKNSGGINLLGYCYDNGIGTDVNVQKAFELYQEAANLGNDTAQFNLALMYENGNGIKNDINQAIYWYKKAAEQGDQDAKLKLNILKKVQN
ncbi:kinase-like domain-containing protein [Rhizophagus diaphanus]|nr:kinase-like domain-containing protein [Rhizophagus diaphanus] [Rhizophagus sp. MUCL 43196]